MTNNLRTAIATFILTAAITPATMLAQSAYPVNFDENEAATNTGAIPTLFCSQAATAHSRLT